MEQEGSREAYEDQPKFLHKLKVRGRHSGYIGLWFNFCHRAKFPPIEALGIAISTIEASIGAAGGG